MSILHSISSCDAHSPVGNATVDGVPRTNSTWRKVLLLEWFRVQGLDKKSFELKSKIYSGVRSPTESLLQEPILMQTGTN